MCDHWSEHGYPVYVSVAAYLGFTSKKKNVKTGSNKPVETGNLEELAAMFSGSGGVIA